MLNLYIGPDTYARTDIRERVRALAAALGNAPAVPDEFYEDAREVRDDVRELCDRLDVVEQILEDKATRVAELEQELASRPAVAPPGTFCPACERSPSGRCWEHVPVGAEATS
jgi:hypothetical protein